MPVPLLCILLCMLAPIGALADMVPFHSYDDYTGQSDANAFLRFFIGNTILSLTLTIILEATLLALLFKQKKMLDAILMNCVTNPVANVMLLLAMIAMHSAAQSQHLVADYHVAILAASFVVIECVVIWVETTLLRRMGVPKPFVTSLTLNIASASLSWIAI